MTRSPWILAARALTTALACCFPVAAQAQPSTPAPPASSPAPATPAASPPSPPPAAAPPGTQGHWVYVQETSPAAPPPAPAPAAPDIVGTRFPIYARATTWDLNVDGAFGRYFGDDANKWTGFVRARAGILFVREPLYSAIGFTYEYSSLASATFGIQAEVLHLDSGFWGQIGGLLDTNGNPGVMAAIGFSVLGVEAQYRSYPGLGEGVAVYAKLRVPVGVLAYVLGTRDAKKPAPVGPPATVTPQ